MDKKFMDVDLYNMPVSFHKWHKKNRSKELPKERYIDSLNDYKDFPLKFYKRIL